MLYAVSQPKEDELLRRMNRWGIRESDLEEKFIHSSGPGGQHVNKSATGVYLKHKPTGIEVKCTQERSQSLNRFLARRWLVNKIENLRLGQESDAQKQIEKIRRQKRKRSKRSKEKMLRAKKLHSETKQMRARPTEE
jgi:peptide chain release factor